MVETNILTPTATRLELHPSLSVPICVFIQPYFRAKQTAISVYENVW